MAHRRVKDVDYDDDDLYDYDSENGEEDMSSEDKKQLQESIAAVRRVIGDDLELSDAEIGETVWHYYFDVEKSVAYLRTHCRTGKRAPSEPKPQKKAVPSRFDQAAQHAQQVPVNASHDLPPCQSTCKLLNVADIFSDVPWLHVPPERLGEITAVPVKPRGRLLGGSGKPSKLAALAAARKKAKEGKLQADTQSNQNSSIALLDRLRLQSEDPPTTPAEEKSNKRKETESANTRPFRYTRAKHADQSSAEEPTSELPAITSPKIEEKEPVVDDIRIQPSVFASTMLGNFVPKGYASSDLFTLPSTQSSSSTSAFVGPSPDDIVIAAQTKGTASSQKKTSGTTGGENAANGLANLKIGDTPAPASKTKSKNINVAAEYEKATRKNAANFVVIGHVDHGKSTLMGRLLYDLKLVNERSYHKMKAEATNSGKSSFALAWVMDATSEERARGITVDIATNHFETEKTRFTILDAPGHRDFIPNMIAGTAQADFAVLVIDASTNAFEAGLKGQTKEHALLARSMGIARLVIAVNKMDTADWSETRFKEISQQMSAFLQSAGFQAKNLVFVPCAGLTGMNVATPPAESPMPWYKGDTLVAALESFEPAQRAVRDPLRLTINDVFRGGPQHPLSISGRLDTGSVQGGEALLAMPAGERATVRGVEVDGETREWAVAGQIATLHLEDIDPIHLRSGDIICSATQSPISNIRAFTVKVLAFEHVMPGAIELHRGRLHAAARVTQLAATLDKASGAVEKKRPRIVKPGALARVRIELDTALPVEAGGRVVLRSEGTTVAAGLVESVEEQKQ